MKTRSRIVATVAVVALFAFGACEAAEDDTEAPANQLGSFQLVGRVDTVSIGTDPAIEVGAGTPTPGGENTPTESGMVELTVQSASAGVRDMCGVERGETVEVWWLTGTRFDPARVLSDLEDALEGTRVSAQGRIFVTNASPTPAAETSPPAASPATSPATPATASPATANCVLIADHIEVSQGAAQTGPDTSPEATATVSPGVRTTPSPTVSPGAPVQR